MVGNPPPSPRVAQVRCDSRGAHPQREAVWRLQKRLFRATLATYEEETVLSRQSAREKCRWPKVLPSRKRNKLTNCALTKYDKGAASKFSITSFKWQGDGPMCGTGVRRLRLRSQTFSSLSFERLESKLALSAAASNYSDFADALEALAILAGGDPNAPAHEFAPVEVAGMPEREGGRDLAMLFSAGDSFSQSSGQNEREDLGYFQQPTNILIFSPFDQSPRYDAHEPVDPIGARDLGLLLKVGDVLGIDPGVWVPETRNFYSQEFPSSQFNNSTGWSNPPNSPGGIPWGSPHGSEPAGNDSHPSMTDGSTGSHEAPSGRSGSDVSAALTVSTSSAPSAAVSTTPVPAARAQGETSEPGAVVFGPTSPTVAAPQQIVAPQIGRVEGAAGTAGIASAQSTDLNLVQPPGSRIAPGQAQSGQPADVATTSAENTALPTSVETLPAVVAGESSDALQVVVVDGSQGVLLAGITLNAEAIDQALSTVLDELHLLGGELITWFDELSVPSWSLAAGAAATLGFAGRCVWLRRNRRSIEEEREEESSSWLFTRLQAPGGQP